ncbi:sensor histidine kinase [Saccharicrinis sp. 156]|uniref:sensor histidine kinase n=1 Tax=Saccharicrinis sp. 156 TaxID=3417574 RepID=UPI003D33C0C2
MNNVGWLISLFLISFGSNVFASEVVLITEDPIHHLLKDSNDIVYIQTKQEIYEFSGEAPLILQYTSEYTIDFSIAISKGNLLVTHENGFTYIENNQQVYLDSLPELITSVKLHGATVLLGTAGKGLFSFDLNTRIVKSIPAVNAGFVNDILVGEQLIWIAHDNGISLLNKASLTLFQKSNLSALISKLFQASDNVIGVGEFGKLYKIQNDGHYRGQTREMVHPNMHFSSNNDDVYGISPEAYYKLSSDLSFKLVAKGMYHHILTHKNVLFLVHGNKLSRKDITQEIHSEGLSNFSLYAENDSILWSGQEGRIVCLKNGIPVKTVMLQSKQRDVFVSSLLVDDKNIIAGTLGDGLYVFDKGGRQLQHILQKESFNKNNIIQLKERDSLMWVAYLNGLLTLNPDDLSIERDFKELLGNNYLFNCLPISRNTFFIGTSGKGILNYNNGKLSSLLDNHSIYTLAQRGDRVFAGTEKNGVFCIRLKTNTAQQISTSNKVLNIVPLESGIVLATDYENLYMDDALNYTYALPGLGLNGMNINSVTENSASIYLGYENGILKIEKSKLSQLGNMHFNLDKPLLFEEKVKDKQSEFKFNENTFTFNFQLYNYYNPENNHYKYRLLGVDSTWYVTGQKSIQYFKLPSGKYQFQVSAGTHAGFEPNLIKAYSFVINKPFWKAIWFLVLSSALLLLLVFYGFRRREKRLLEKERLRSARTRAEIIQLKSQLDPHFLFNSLNSLAEIIEEDTAAASKSLLELSDLYRSILKLKEVDIISLKADVELANQYFRIHQLRFEDLIHLDINVPHPESKSIVSMSCQILIENAIKHNIINRKNKLFVSIYMEDDYLVVKNNKSGSNTAGNSEGIGLKNLEQRFKLLTKKNIRIVNSKETFIVKLPLIDG